MEYIDKTKDEIKANEIVNSFLDDGWDNEYSKYVNIDFNTFKPLIRDLLLSSHSHRCAYCMKAITREEVTIEHIIPVSITLRNIAEFTKYLNPPTGLKIVVPKEVFLTAHGKQVTPPFPHHIAWNNLIPNCDSKYHCNLWREDKFVRPFILSQTDISHILYTNEGLCSSLIYKDELNNLNLNHQELINIRKIWFYLSSKINVSQIDTKELVLSYITLLDKDNIGLSGTYSDDKNYKHLLQYNYFFNVKPII